MVAGGSRGGSEASVLVGGMEMGLEGEHGFVGVGETAPLAAGHIEKSSSVDDVVALADHGRHGGRIVAGGGEANAVLELCEEDLDGCGRIPRSSHAEQIGIEFSLSDAAVVVPEVKEKLEAGDVAKSESVVVEGANVGGRRGKDELVAERLVSFVVGAESGLGGGVETIDLRDLGGGGLSRMFRLSRWVDGRKERDAREKEVFGRGDGEGEMAVDAVARVGRDGGGVAVELGLRHADGGVGGLASCGGGQRSDDGRRERGGDGGGGGSGGGRHGGEAKSGVKFINFC